jgi:hypothetical protein
MTAVLINRDGVKMTAKIRSMMLLAVLLTIWLSAGCERSTHVALKDGLRPVFALSGSGALAIFVVYGPEYSTKAEKPSDEDFALWKIKPSGGYLAGSYIEELKSIVYGVVPPDYV